MGVWCEARGGGAIVQIVGVWLARRRRARGVVVVVVAASFRFSPLLRSAAAAAHVGYVELRARSSNCLNVQHHCRNNAHRVVPRERGWSMDLKKLCLKHTIDSEDETGIGQADRPLFEERVTARLETTFEMDGAAHACYLSDPGAFNAAVVAFLLAALPSPPSL